MRPALVASLAVILLTAFLAGSEASPAAGSPIPDENTAGLRFFRVHPLNDSLVIAGGEVFERDGAPGSPAKLPDGVRLLPSHAPAGAEKWVLVEEPASSLSPYITKVLAAWDDYDRPLVEVELNERGARLFEKISADNIGRQLAVALDGRVYSVPVVHEKISGGKFIISGSFSAEEASDLALILRASAPPQALE